MARAALIIAAALLHVSPASAAPGFERLEIGRPLTDNSGTVAWQETSAGPARVLFDADDDFSAARSLPSPPQCTLGAVGLGRLAYSCYGSRGGMTPVFQDIASGATAPPAGADRVREDSLENNANGESYEVQALGSRLLRISVSGVHVDTDVYLDWTTGGFRRSFRATSRTVEDLDEADGRATLCAPLSIPFRRGTTLEEPGRVPQLARYVRPFLVRLGRRGVILERCGRRRSLVLERGVRAEPVLTRRYVAWVNRGNLRVRMLPSGPTRSWRLPRDARYSRLVATERRLFVLGSFPTVYVLDLGDG
jgi:hypothetical protein